MIIVGNTPKFQQDTLMAIVKPKLISAGYNVCIDTHIDDSTRKYSTTFYINFIP